MQALSLIEGHPVLDLGLIPVGAVAATQDRRALLIGQREYACLGAAALGSVAADDGCLHEYFTVLIEPQILGGQIDFHIGACQIILAVPSQIIGVAPGVLFIIDRFSADFLSGQDILLQSVDLLLLNDGIAVFIISGREMDLVPVMIDEGPLPVSGIIPVLQALYEFRDLIIVQVRLTALQVEPGPYCIKAQDLRFFTEFVVHPGAAVLIDRFGLRDQVRVVFGHRRLFIDLFRERQFLLEIVVRRVLDLIQAVFHPGLQVSVFKFVAVDLVHDHASAFLFTVVYIGVLTGESGRCQGRSAYLVLKSILVIVPQDIRTDLIADRNAVENRANGGFLLLQGLLHGLQQAFLIQFKSIGFQIPGQDRLSVLHQADRRILIGIHDQTGGFRRSHAGNILPVHGGVLQEHFTVDGHDDYIAEPEPDDHKGRQQRVHDLLPSG